MNVLVVVSGGLTETLQATPLLRSLHAGLPDSDIILAGPSPAAELTAGLPMAAETLGLSVLDRRPRLAALPGAWLRLRRRRIDAALLCTTSAPARLLVYAAGVPQRYGIAGGGASSLLLGETVDPHEGENDAAAWLRLAGRLGVEHQLHQLEFVPPDAARRHGEARLIGCGLEDGRLLVAIAPGLAMADFDDTPPSSTLWDPERFAHLANQLSHRQGAGIVFVGTAGDRQLVEEVLVDVDALAVNLCGELTLAETGAVLARCDLLVAGDSPLLHLAAAVGTPSVGLFGPTDGRRRGPYGPDHRVIQGLPGPPGSEDGSPISRIRVEDVLAGIETSL